MTISYRIIAFVFLITGLFLLAIGVIYKEISVGIFVFFPFVVGSGPYIALTMMMFLFSMIALFFSFSKEGRTIQKHRIERDIKSDETKDSYSTSHVKAGGVILIGPIPIVFGSSKKMVVSLLCITLLLLFIIMFVIPRIVQNI